MSTSTRRIAFLALPLAVLLVLPSYLRAYRLAGASDAPTLLRGDIAVVNQAAYWVRLPYTQVNFLRVARPKRGDMVLLKGPELQNLIFKRVIGLPGETVEIRDNRVVINGRILPLKQLPAADFLAVPKSHHMGTTVFDEDGHWVAFTPGTGEHATVAAVSLARDEYFLLGDNRDVSLDCRKWGPLKEQAIRGKVIFTMASGPRNK